jgi:hypothetical protein
VEALGSAPGTAELSLEQAARPSMATTATAAGTTRRRRRGEGEVRKVVPLFDGAAVGGGAAGGAEGEEVSG